MIIAEWVYRNSKSDGVCVMERSTAKSPTTNTRLDRYGLAEQISFKEDRALLG
jgi:hypothetical protein